MLATLISAGSSGAVTQTLYGRSARTIRRVTIACSSRSFVGLQQLLAEVVVDRGVGRAARRAGQRDGRGALALAAHEQLRPGGDERGVAACPRRRRSRSRSRRAARRTPPRRRARRRVHGDLAGQADLLELARPDALDGARDRRLVVLGRRDRGDLEAPDRARVEQRQRRVAQRGRRAPRAARAAGRGGRPARPAR